MKRAFRLTIGAATLLLSPAVSVAQSDGGASAPARTTSAAPAGAVSVIVDRGAVRSPPRYLSGKMPGADPVVAAAVADGRMGRLLAEATVGADGALSDIVLIEPSGDADIDRAAIAALQGWKLSPGRDAAGKPVAVRAKFPLPVGGLRRIEGANPEFPDAAKALGHNGKIVVRATIDAAGRIVEPHVEESTRSDLLDATTLAAMAAWRYAPPRDLAGRPLRREVRFEFEFNQAAGGGDNYLAGIRGYRCATFLREYDWWTSVHGGEKPARFPLSSYLRGMQLLVPEALGPPRPPGSKPTAGFMGHDTSWANAVARCRAAPDAIFIDEYRKG